MGTKITVALSIEGRQRELAATGKDPGSTYTIDLEALSPTDRATMVASAYLDVYGRWTLRSPMWWEIASNAPTPEGALAALAAQATKARRREVYAALAVGVAMGMGPAVGMAFGLAEAIKWLTR